MTEKKRRNPKQARAQATVDAILEATFHILETDGLAQLTTNGIAERAGVSIGTLYQYFSDRDEILAMMGKRQAEGIQSRITDVLEKSPDPESIRTIVRAIMNGMQGSAETRIVLSDALFRVHGEGAVSDQYGAFFDFMSARPEFGFALKRESVFIITHSVVCLLRAAAAEPAMCLKPEALEDELVLLMESYIGALALRAQKQAAN